jgi:hypothetical protein
MSRLPVCSSQDAIRVCQKLGVMELSDYYSDLIKAVVDGRRDADESDRNSRAPRDGNPMAALFLEIL